jgi:hypothetical protein
MKLNKYHIISFIGISLSLLLVGSFFLILNRPSSTSSSTSIPTLVGSQDHIRKNFSLSDLDLLKEPNQITFTTSGSVTVSQGPFSLFFSGDQQQIERIEIQSREDRLLIHSRNLSSLGDRLEIQLTIPSLRTVALVGAGRLVLSNFELSILELNLDGAGRITIEHGSVDQLNLNVRGVGRVDVNNFLSTNAMINLEGAASVTLEMGGGILSGKLEGLGSLQYRGTITDEQVSIRGLGSVKAID